MERDRNLVTDGQIQIQLASVQTPSPQADGMSEGRESAVAGELHTTPTWSWKINLLPRSSFHSAHKDQDASILEIRV